MLNFYDKIRKIKSLEELSDNFETWVILESVNAADWSTLYDILDEFSDEFSISNFSKIDNLKSAARSEMLRSMASKEFKNLNSVGNTFDNLIDEYSNPDKKGGSSGGGGSVSVGLGSSSVVDVPPVKNTFNDLDKASWAIPAVENLCEKGVLNGYPDGSFRPNDSVSREEFIKMIVMALGLHNKNSVCKFDDVPADSWYYSYVSSAYEFGLTKGNGISFGSGQYITRQEAATIVYRAAVMLEKELGEGKEFGDHSNIAEYAQEAVHALGGSILNGDENGNFNPAAVTTRAQAAQMLYQLLQIR